MCDQANRHRTNHSFEPGDWVWVRLQPYRQHSLERRTHQKLGPRFSGPYQVLRRIGSVAYELQLPSSARVHPVFHVSLLRPFKGPAGEHSGLSTKSKNLALPTPLNSSPNPNQNALNSPYQETNENTPCVTLTNHTDLAVIEPHAHAPHQQAISMPHNHINTRSDRINSSVPRVPLTSGAVSPRLEPHVHQQTLPTPLNCLNTLPDGANSSVPRVPLTDGAASPRLEPNASAPRNTNPNPEATQTTPLSQNPNAPAVAKA